MMAYAFSGCNNPSAKDGYIGKNKIKEGTDGTTAYKCEEDKDTGKLISRQLSSEIRCLSLYFVQAWLAELLQ